MVLWTALAGGASVACQSDAGSICEKLFACDLLKEEPKTKPNPQGFNEDVCESQVEDELSEARQHECLECLESHSCAEIVEGCRAVCEPHY